MPYIVPITEFRKNIFTITERVARTGEAVDVEKEGKRIVRVVPVKDDPAEKARYALEHVLPKLAGAWKTMTKADLARVRSLRRGSIEKRYWKRAIFS
ncbi:hypothetical protein HY339_00210 [Candidatus Gottesmanbacteria bacterium]|nr:hypothetical protein [Candidatus Gottesmanbacteria bacterium]